VSCVCSCFGNFSIIRILSIASLWIDLVAHNFAADTATEQAAVEDLHRQFKSLFAFPNLFFLTWFIFIFTN
jgi:hypothetical protein